MLSISGRLASCLLASQSNSGIKLAGGDRVGNTESGLGLQYDHIALKVFLFFTERSPTFSKASRDYGENKWEFSDLKVGKDAIRWHNIKDKNYSIIWYVNYQ